MNTFDEKKEDIIASRGLSDEVRYSPRSIGPDVVSDKASSLIRLANSPQNTAFVNIEFQKEQRKSKLVKKPNLLMSKKQVNKLSNKLHVPSGT